MAQFQMGIPQQSTVLCTFEQTCSMRRTDKDLLVKGIRSFMMTALTMFLAPILIYQAFKNQENLLFWPVLIVGLVLAGLAIYLGFRSLRIVMEAVFGKKEKR